MEHKEFKRIVQCSDKAVLFIHGIAGTPNHFLDFVALVPKDISVYNMLLDGHGKGVQDFSRTSMEKWEKQVETAVAELAAVHKEIYIVAHSMGTLFAMEQALREPKIAKLFLLAVPLKLSLKPGLFINSGKVYFDMIRPDDAVAVAAKRCYGIGSDKNVLHYIGWIPRYLELFRKIRETGRSLNGLRVPCAVFQSRKDEMVSIRTRDSLLKNPIVSVTVLPESGHYYYAPKDFDILMTSFGSWLYARMDAVDPAIS